MKLMTAEVRKGFEKFPLYSQESRGDAAVVVAKFFSPVGRWTFFATEGQQDGDDFTMFGFVRSALESDYDELGYVSLNEIASARLPFGLGFERDLSFPVAKRTLGEAKAHS